MLMLMSTIWLTTSAMGLELILGRRYREGENTERQTKLGKFLCCAVWTEGSVGGC